MHLFALRKVTLSILLSFGLLLEMVKEWANPSDLFVLRYPLNMIFSFIITTTLSSKPSSKSINNTSGIELKTESALVFGMSFQYSLETLIESCPRTTRLAKVNTKKIVALLGVNFSVKLM